MCVENGARGGTDQPRPRRPCGIRTIQSDRAQNQVPLRHRRLQRRPGRRSGPAESITRPRHLIQARALFGCLTGIDQATHARGKRNLARLCKDLFKTALNTGEPLFDPGEARVQAALARRERTEQFAGETLQIGTPA